MKQTPQNYEKRTQRVRNAFAKKFKSGSPMLNLSWSNWGFGREPLSKSLARLANAGIKFIELHGNHYTKDQGYDAGNVKKLLNRYHVTAAGICGMFGPENDLSSTSAISRQNAIDYILREIEFGHQLGVKYMLIVPGAVGRPDPYDDYEFERSTDTLRIVADDFLEAGIRAAIEPIRSDEVSFCHSFEDALKYIKTVAHSGVQYINGDLYHMLHHEDDPAMAILKYGRHMVNLHMADTNRNALGTGVYNVDAIISALYAVGYNNPNCFCTCEPLGPGGNVYRAMHGITPEKELDDLVMTTARYWRARENSLRKQAAV